MRAAAQTFEQIVQALAAATVVGRQIVRQRDVGDGLDGAPQMIEDQQRVDHQQVRQWQIERVVGRRGNAWLELARELVRQVAHGATAETRQARQPGDALPSHHTVDQIAFVKGLAVRVSELAGV